jgi:hypothetical protein
MSRDISVNAMMGYAKGAGETILGKFSHSSPPREEKR